VASGNKFCIAGQWTVTHQTPNFGFVYLTNVMSVPVRIRWRAFSSFFPFYSDGATDLPVGETKAILFGAPSEYVQFEVNPEFHALLWAS
jgi:hypothetical protein